MSRGFAVHGFPGFRHYSELLQCEQGLTSILSLVQLGACLGLGVL